MDQLIKIFHIDWKLMLAQIVNFGIVLGVLWYFALKPLIKIMQQRGREIEKSLADAEEIEKKLAATNQEKEEVITAARQEAQKIIDEAKILAAKQGQRTIVEARQETEKIVRQAKEQIQEEKLKLLSDVKKETTALVVAVAEKVLAQTIDKEVDQKLVEKYLNNLEK